MLDSLDRIHTSWNRPGELSCSTGRTVSDEEIADMLYDYQFLSEDAATWIYLVRSPGINHCCYSLMKHYRTLYHLECCLLNSPVLLFTSFLLDRMSRFFMFNRCQTLFLVGFF